MAGVLLAGAPPELNAALRRFLGEVVRGRPWQVRGQSPEEVQVAVFRGPGPVGPSGTSGTELWRVPTEGEPEQLEQTFSLTLRFDGGELADLLAEYADHCHDAEDGDVPAHPSQRAVWEALIAADLMPRDERDQFGEEASG